MYYSLGTYGFWQKINSITLIDAGLPYLKHLGNSVFVHAVDLITLNIVSGYENNFTLSGLYLY